MVSICIVTGLKRVATQITEGKPLNGTEVLLAFERDHATAFVSYSPEARLMAGLENVVNLLPWMIMSLAEVVGDQADLPPERFSLSVLMHSSSTGAPLPARSG